ncbi:hypothetical protein Dimus_006440 [Dionaea muscipula]
MSAKGGQAVVCCPPSCGDEAGSGRRLLLLLSASIDEQQGVMGGLFLDDAKQVVMVLGGEVGRSKHLSLGNDDLSPLVRIATFKVKKLGGNLLLFFSLVVVDDGSCSW